VTKQIVGVCEEISEKNGWTSFHINVGSQYPVRLSTKVAAIIEQGRGVGQETATWTFKESQGGENPNKPGTYYTNRYLDKVEAGSVAEPDTASGTGQAPQRPTEGVHEPLPIGDRERGIVRQACLKAAATLFTGKGNVEVISDDPADRDNVTEVIAAAQRFENWVMRDLDDIPF
jgi:hypothetical protein